MRLVLEFWALLWQKLPAARSKEAAPEDLIFTRESEREPAAHDYEIYYWSSPSGPWY